ncbi:D-alanyl-D-alanine carboxypeptidase family protein [Paracoccus litorisediminis]|uniref:D-alanyl-D-alanine carboxypeptidase family protein n=1 Tax=Paracoccus litorisediminis TaxID=2006130 RepID=UPI00372F56D3
MRIAIRSFRPAILLTMALIAWAILSALWATANAAPYAAHVMDAKTGETLYSHNADTHLHPASLTKMMTLYLAFEDIERGRKRLDSKIKVSKHAAGEAPSRLGLRAGQEIELRYLIRAAAIKSANDAATAIGEGLEGSEEAFAKRMNAKARALGMTNSHFLNANGLTRQGHYSTARDMSVLGRRIFYDFPQFYEIFSRRRSEANGVQLNHTNRKFLDSYEGADGIKTGYTVPAGFNLTASAERDGRRLIATVFGGKSTAERNRQVAQLLDAGFGKSAMPRGIADKGKSAKPSATRAEAMAQFTSAKRPKRKARIPVKIPASPEEVEKAIDTVALSRRIDELSNRRMPPPKRPPRNATVSTKGSKALGELDFAATGRPAPRPGN